MSRFLLLALLLAPPALASEDEGHEAVHHVDYSATNPETGMPNWLSGEHSQLYPLGMHAMNLLLLFAIVGYFAGRPIVDGVRNRALGIRKELVGSARARDEAKGQFEEIEARLSKFEAEAEAMQQEARQLAKHEEEALVERAHAEADRIAASAQRTIRDETARAREALRRDAVQLAVKLAKELLEQRTSAEDQKRLATEFLTAIDEERSHG